jgi:hypothetical protein
MDHPREVGLLRSLVVSDDGMALEGGLFVYGHTVSAGQGSQLASEEPSPCQSGAAVRPTHDCPSLYKTELIDERASGRNWSGLREVERETASWVQWYNTERLSQGVSRLWHDVARATRQEACATDLPGCSLLLQAALKGASRHTGRVRHTCCTARAE